MLEINEIPDIYATLGGGRGRECPDFGLHTHDRLDKSHSAKSIRATKK